MKKASSFSMYLFLSVVAMASVGPFLWGVSTSLKPESKIFVFPPRLIPAPATIKNYTTALRGGMLVAFRNSAVVAAGAVASTLLFGALAGYSISRLEWRGRNLVLVLLIAPQMLPGLVNLAPLYVMMSKMRLLDTYAVLILLEGVGSLPMTVWIMKGFFDTVPTELEEAAMIDGCTRLGVLRSIMLPLAGPGLAAAALFAFLNSWNSFLIPAVMTSSKAIRTAPLVVYSYIGDYMVDWGGLMAAAALASLPVVILFLVLQRQFISSLSAGVSKG